MTGGAGPVSWLTNLTAHRVVGQGIQNQLFIMHRKRTPSPHQKQMRFMLFLFGTLAIGLAFALMLLINLPSLRVASRFHF
ncbi:MAG TPA: hypothetical protein VF607_01715 [Verrucomicrobiae bacterium]